MLIRASLLAVLSVGLAAPALPCTVVNPLPPATALVESAPLIVRARATAVLPGSGPSSVLTSTATRIEFTVIEVLKGDLDTPTLRLNGVAVNRDDRNDGPVPYGFVRMAGRGGGCYALEYRLGAEYLFLLQRGEDPPTRDDSAEWSPYWAPLSPVNEQLSGDDADPWLAWVRGQLPPRG